MTSARRFPSPWHAEKTPGGYVVRDASGQALALSGTKIGVKGGRPLRGYNTTSQSDAVKSILICLIGEPHVVSLLVQIAP